MGVVKDSLPPVPEDKEIRAKNQARNEEQKKVKEDKKAKAARKALLAEKDLALNQAQTDLAEALSQVSRWHQSSAEYEKRAKGRTCALFLRRLCTFELAFPDLSFLALFFYQNWR